jgi:DNA end-binding protein Ku
MNTLHWPDEIRPVSELKGVDADVDVNPRELQMAKALVENLAEDRFDPNRFQDDYHEALMEVVNAKVQGQEVVAAPDVESAPAVMDLMEALKASVDQAKKQRTTKARTARKPAAKKAAAG